MMPLLIEAALRATGLGLVAWLALRLLPIHSPHLQKSAWTAVLLASLSMPWLMRAVAAPLIRAPAYVLTLSPGAHGLQPQTDLWHGMRWLYLLVAAALLLRLLTLWLRMWWAWCHARVVETGWTLGMDVRVSSRVRSPATFAGTILLPETYPAWTKVKRDAVLSHELSHVLNHDCHLLWLAQLHACLFWFNPLAWWLRRRLATLAEATADEAALRALGDRPGYAQILLEFATHDPPNRSAMSMSQQSNLPDRIDHILSGTQPAGFPRRRLLAFGAVLPVAIAVAALQLADTRSAQAEPSAAGDVPQRPHIVSYGGLARLKDYYPPEALKAGVEGRVELAVTLDSQGRATNTLILLEEPADQGFGAAASSAAHTIVYSNPTGRPVQFSFTVKFALDHVSEGLVKEDVAPAR
jgi:TonB family protein